MIRWFTRDRSVDGVLSELVTEWSARPERQRAPSGYVRWLTPRGQWSAFVAVHTVEEIEPILKGGVPDDDLQCVRYG